MNEKNIMGGFTGIELDVERKLKLIKSVMKNMLLEDFDISSINDISDTFLDLEKIWNSSFKDMKKYFYFLLEKQKRNQ